MFVMVIMYLSVAVLILNEGKVIKVIKVYTRTKITKKIWSCDFHHIHAFTMPSKLHIIERSHLFKI